MSVPTSVDPRWLDLVDAVARRRLGSRDRTGPALSAAVRAVSAVYTRRERTGPASLASTAGADDVLAARLRFFLPRDLPKVGGPLRELAWAGLLRTHGTLRVLDVGAGLGTSTFGALDTIGSLGAGADLAMEVTALDTDARALSIFADLSEALRAAPWASEWPRLRVRTLVADAMDPRRIPPGPFDLVVAGFVLNELSAAEEGHAAAVSLAEWLRALVARVSPDGALVVLEPALAMSARALHAARDVLMQVPGHVCIFAPCLHAGPCPMLERARDWCHEDEPARLPPALAAVARGAGLRFEGLTFSYLTLRRDGATLAGALARGDARFRDRRALRIVGGARPTKGKTTITACAEGGRVELIELARDVGRDGVVGQLARGDVVGVVAPQRATSVRLGATDGTAEPAPVVRARPSSSDPQQTGRLLPR